MNLKRLLLFPLFALLSVALSAASLDLSFDTAADGNYFYKGTTAGGSAWTWGSNVGVAGGGGLNFNAGANNIWILKGGFVPEVGKEYKLNFFLKNKIQSGYGGIGFTTQNQDGVTNLGYAAPANAIGFSAHGGGYLFHNNTASASDTASTWAAAGSSNMVTDEANGNWVYLDFTLTCTATNTFSAVLKVYNVDQVTGVVGSVMSQTLVYSSKVNSVLGGAAAIYPYFATAGTRFIAADGMKINSDASGSGLGAIGGNDAADPIHRWIFSSDKSDSIGDWDGTAVGAGATIEATGGPTASLPGYLKLDGSSYVTLGTKTLPANFTVSAWMKIDSGATAGIQGLMANGSEGGITNGFKLRVNTPGAAEGKLGIEAGNGSTSNTYLFSGAGEVPLDGTWRRVAFSVNRTAGTAALYSNSVKVAEGSIASDFGLSGTLNIGAYSSGNLRLKGGIADLRIYAVALTPEDIANIGAENNLDIDIDYLIVGGGGGGGGIYHAGGGGGGGVLAGSTTIAPTGSYTIVVGAGGSAGNSSLQGGDGGDSSAFELTAIGGGGGGGEATGGRTGGSGGGGAWSPSSSPGSGTVGQGNGGGSGVGLATYNAGQPRAGGGGGGAGAAGANADAASQSAGAGGAGAISYISSAEAVYFGGGGGGGGGFNTVGDSRNSVGGAGGLGGGGNGANTLAGASGAGDGTDGLGGGGGGAAQDGALAGKGGSGVVIVRYLGEPQATGGTITEFEDEGGSYTVHTFTASGVLDFSATPPEKEETTLTYVGPFLDADGSGSTTLLAQFGSPVLEDNVIKFSHQLNTESSFTSAGTGMTNAEGRASRSATLASGVYDIKVEFDGDDDLEPSEDTGTLVVANPGDSAYGGGWYKATTSPSVTRASFGFLVQKKTNKKTNVTTYSGQVLWTHHKRQRFKSTAVTDVASTTELDYAKAAHIGGTGVLEDWEVDAESPDGGFWTNARDVYFLAKVCDGGTVIVRKKASDKPDAFGIRFGGTGTVTPIQLSGGSIKIN
jgi:hypothetical protein